MLMLIPFMALMYFTIIRPEKKRRKQEQEMRDSVQIGDEITTLGGIMGRVVTIKEDSLVIETGSDRNKIKIARWGIQTNNTAEERLQAEKEAAAAAKAAEKQAAAEALKEKKKKK
ncbi:MAG TPA: preprotein translocase subunit YajC [Clostridiales bacterium]|nr:preprotein translocase subunit YajC [Clostridiales bacterium]